MMKIEIADYCIRCGICEDLYPDLFQRNYTDHCIDVRMDARVRQASDDCAVAAIRNLK